MKPNKKRTYEISSETSLAKLSGIEVAINQLDDLAREVLLMIPEKRGIVFACKILAKRIFDDCNWVNGNVDSQKIDPEEAKIRIDQIKRIVDIVNEIGNINSKDVISLQAETAGHKKSANLLSKRYGEIAMKYEKDERVAREDAVEELIEKMNGEEEEKKKKNKNRPVEDVIKNLKKIKTKKIDRKLNQEILYKRFDKKDEKTTLRSVPDKK